MEETGGLLSMGSHRVRHDWSDLVCMHALEEEMAAHSSVLAWRMPGTEEPGGLPSMGSQRVGHDWSDLAAAAAAAEVVFSVLTLLGHWIEVSGLLLHVCFSLLHLLLQNFLNFVFWISYDFCNKFDVYTTIVDFNDLVLQYRLILWKLTCL